MKKFFITLLTALLVLGIAQADSFLDEHSEMLRNAAHEYGFWLDDSRSDSMSPEYSYTTMYRMFPNNQYVIIVYGDENSQGYSLQLYNSQRMLLIENQHLVVARLNFVVEGSLNGGVGYFTVMIKECKTKKCKVKLDIYVKPVGISI